MSKALSIVDEIRQLDAFCAELSSDPRISHAEFLTDARAAFPISDAELKRITKLLEQERYAPVLAIVSAYQGRWNQNAWGAAMSQLELENLADVIRHPSRLIALCCMGANLSDIARYSAEHWVPGPDCLHPMDRVGRTKSIAKAADDRAKLVRELARVAKGEAVTDEHGTRIVPWASPPTRPRDPGTYDNHNRWNPGSLEQRDHFRDETRLWEQRFKDCRAVTVEPSESLADRLLSWHAAHYADTEWWQKRPQRKPGLLVA